MKTSISKYQLQSHRSPTTGSGGGEDAHSPVKSTRSSHQSYHSSHHSSHNSSHHSIHNSHHTPHTATTLKSHASPIVTTSTITTTQPSVTSPTNSLAASSSSGKHSFKLQTSAKHDKISPYDKAKRIMSYILTHCQPNIEGEYSVNQIEHFILQPNTSPDSYRKRVSSELLDLLDKMLKIAGVDLYEWIEFAANSYKQGLEDDMIDLEMMNADKACLNRGQFITEFNRLCLDLRQPLCSEGDIKFLFKYVAGDSDDARVDHCNLDIAMRHFRNTAYKFRKSNAIYKEIKELGEFMEKLQLHLGGKVTMMNTKVNGVDLEKLIFNIVVQFEAFHNDNALPTTFEIDKSGSSRSQNSFSIRSMNGSGSIKSQSGSGMKKQNSFGRVFANTFSSLTKTFTRSLSTKKIIPTPSTPPVASSLPPSFQTPSSPKNNELDEDLAKTSLRLKPTSPTSGKMLDSSDGDTAVALQGRGMMKKMDSFQQLTRMMSVQHFFRKGSKQFSDKTLESHDWEDDEVHNTVADLPSKNSTMIKKHVVKRKRFPMGNSLFNALLNNNTKKNTPLTPNTSSN